MKKALLFAALVLASAAYAGPILLTDDFGGDALDFTKWAPSTPKAGGSVAVNDGDLVLTNRGRVLTNDLFQQNIQIDLSFQFTGNTHDSFKIVTRTDGTTTNDSGEFDKGIVASFRMQSDGGDTTGNVLLSDLNHPFYQNTIGVGTFAMTQNETYNVRLLFSGYNVGMYINDYSTPFLSGYVSNSYGSQIGLDNREGGAAGSGISEGSQVRVDHFTVSSVPEAGMTVLYLGGGIAALLVPCFRRRRGTA